MEIKLKHIVIVILTILTIVINYFMINHLITTDGKNISGMLMFLYVIIILFDCGLFFNIMGIIIDYCEKNWNKNINIKL